MTRHSDMIRLENAFDELARAGIIAKHNYWCCGGCVGGVLQAEYNGYSEAQRETTIGYVYYHEQSAERAINNGYLQMYYGSLPVIEDGGRGDDRFIGEMIAKALCENGFAPEWDGDPNSFIDLSNFSVTLDEMPEGEGSTLHQLAEDDWYEEDDEDENF